MKRAISLLLLLALTLTLLAGCAAAPATPTTEATEAKSDTGFALTPAADQSPEEQKVLRVLSIGQSHSQDSIWLLQEVLRTERPEDEFFIAECLLSVTLVDHVANAKGDVPNYKYCVNTDGKWDTREGWTIKYALMDQKWDIVIINESSRMLGLESVMNQGLVQEMADYVHSILDYDFKLLYNWTWTTPEDQVFHHLQFDPQPPGSFWESFTRDYNADREYHYNAMADMLKKYVMPIENIDGILYSATPIQYASEVLGLPEGEVSDPDPDLLPFSLKPESLYRDYIHLSDYGRLYIGYMWYAQMYGLKQLEEINVDVIPAHLRHLRWIGQGDVTLTQEMKDWLKESVNFALKNPIMEEAQ